LIFVIVVTVDDDFEYKETFINT